MDPNQLRAWADRLLEMDAECAAMSRAMGPEAHRRGVENRLDPMYQAWCLVGGIKHTIAAEWLRVAAKQIAEEGHDG